MIKLGTYPKVGINLTFYKGNINKAQKFEFKQKIADNEYLTDKINEALLIDISNSLLYLDTTGKITRPARISGYRYICNSSHLTMQMNFVFPRTNL